MNAERWQKVKQILETAIALPGNQQSAYVEKVCGEDSELRGEVLSLLQSHEQAGSIFLNNPVADLRSAAAPAPALSRIGRRIGAYQIITEIAHGGMGEVYRATRADGAYDQQVAIKLVRVGFDTPELLERFRHERQILATLEHPNIARLLDAGTTDEGIPYFVMELIEGTPINQYSVGKGLGQPERLQLFRQVCLAVQYAHQRLIIHRDIKPSNILVTAAGVPKLLDFGIAKVFDPAAGNEATVLRPMTPEYASPEQILGDSITTASDVYSLGVVLYELLTGRSPYPENARTSLEFAKAICEVEPARPSTVPNSSKTIVLHMGRSGESVNSIKARRFLRGDLDNIVLKALRKEPPRRYSSVEQLADDIQRHLDGLPVSATPDSARYRVGKFVRRNKVGVAASALVVLALGAGVATTLWQARVAFHERARAERRFNDVRKLANSFLFEFDEAIKNLPGSTPARSLIVKRALEYLDGLAAEARGDRSLQMEIASAYQRVAEVQGDPMFPNLGDSKGALESSTKAMGILESLSRSKPEDQQVRLALASTHQEISDVLAFSGDTAGAVEHSGEALKIYASLSAQMVNDWKFQTQHITQTYHYANLLKLAGDLGEAAGQYRNAVDLSQAMVVSRPSVPDGKIHLATSFDGLGNVLQEEGDTAGALENRRKGLAIREELAKLDPNNAHYRRQLAFSHHNVGLSLMEDGDIASALTHFRQELLLFDALSAADPKDVQGRRNRSLAHKQIGDALMSDQDVRGALREYRAALNIDRELAALDAGNSQAILDLSFSEAKTGSALGKLGQSEKGLGLLRKGIEAQEALLAKDPHHVLLYSHLANSYGLLSNCVLNSGDRNAAIEYARKAVGARLLFEEKSPKNNTNRAALAEAYLNLGNVLGPNHLDAALKQYNKAIEVLEHLISSSPNNAKYRINLADVLSKQARIYADIAEREQSPTGQLQFWAKAKSSYQQSEELWNDLRTSGKLPLNGAHSIQQIAGELARCDSSLAKLQGSH